MTKQVNHMAESQKRRHKKLLHQSISLRTKQKQIMHRNRKKNELKLKNAHVIIQIEDRKIELESEKLEKNIKILKQYKQLKNKKKKKSPAAKSWQKREVERMNAAKAKKAAKKANRKANAHDVHAGRHRSFDTRTHKPSSTYRPYQAPPRSPPPGQQSSSPDQSLRMSYRTRHAMSSNEHWTRDRNWDEWTEKEREEEERKDQERKAKEREAPRYRPHHKSRY